MAIPRPTRRRVGAAEDGAPQTFEARIAASLDDGIRYNTGFQNTTDYMLGGHHTTNLDYESFMRFDGVTVPGGATIIAAYLALTGRGGTNDGSQKTNVYMEAADDPVAPTSKADMDGRTRTTAFTAWDDHDFVLDVEDNSDSIVDVVQEVVDRGGWASGQAMQILWDNDGSVFTSYGDCFSWDGDSSQAPLLHIEFTT